MTRRTVSVAVTACALIAAIVFGVLAGLAHRRPADPDPGPADAAVAAVTSLMTFAPDDSRGHRDAVATHLTGALAADYAITGPDVVFPSAVASRVTMTVDVTDAATAVHGDHSARVMLFAEQTVVVGGRSDSLSHIQIARWAWMTRVEGHWLMARLTPVSPQT